ncbi:MAG: phosphoserine phosphatase, partial [Candidatus Krumholzibacteriia bacterium]
MGGRGKTKPTWAREMESSTHLFLAASDGLGAEGAAKLGDWLVQNVPSAEVPQVSDVAVRLTFKATGPQAFALHWAATDAFASTDVAVVPQKNLHRSLLMCDMDSTIITTESLDELAGFVGISNEVAAITTRAMNGEIGFREALVERVSLLKGLRIGAIAECVSQIEYNPGARALIAGAKASGLRTVLVSGGFSPFAEHVAIELGFDRWVANNLETEAGRLTGRVLDPVVTAETKVAVMKEECASLGITPRNVCAIGDGANDVAML